MRDGGERDGNFEQQRALDKPTNKGRSEMKKIILILNP